MAEKKIVGNETIFTHIERILGEGGGVELRIKGQSMRPFLRNERDTVRLVPINGGNLERGMVVLFRYHGRHILHRIVHLKGNEVLLRGDGNSRLAESASRDDIIAYAESIRRGNRTIHYRSARWVMLTARSLGLKALRTLYRDILKPFRSVGT